MEKQQNKINFIQKQESYLNFYIIMCSQSDYTFMYLKSIHIYIVTLSIQLNTYMLLPMHFMSSIINKCVVSVMFHVHEKNKTIKKRE